MRFTDGPGFCNITTELITAMLVDTDPNGMCVLGDHL